MQDKSISVVTSLYKSENYVDEFYERCSSTLRKLTNKYEIIFVNDGSPDNSSEKVLKIGMKDASVHLLDLSRNFGHHFALIAGIEAAAHEIIFIIDCDLEEAPEDIELLLQTFLQDTEVEMVYGVQKSRKGGMWERITGALHYKLINLASEISIPANQMTLRLMSRKFVNLLNSYTESSFSLFQLFSLVGLKTKPIFLTKKNISPSTYTFSKKIKLLLLSLTANSVKPLILFSYLGITASFFGFAVGIYSILKKIFFGASIGWASIIASIWILSGLIIFCLSLVGIYLSHAITEVKRRPRYSIKDFY
jgi:putative glycosyltransferase